MWQRQPEAMRQIELAREVFSVAHAFLWFMLGASGRSSCRGGDVQMNPQGREVCIARNLSPTAAGLQHPLMTGRPMAFDAPCVHLDIVTIPPGEITVLAGNGNTPIQAAEIHADGGVFWGVQYHPEFDLKTLGVIMKRYKPILLQEGMVRDEAQAAEFADDLIALHEDRNRKDIAWRYGIGADILDDARRLTKSAISSSSRSSRKSRRGAAPDRYSCLTLRLPAQSRNFSAMRAQHSVKARRRAARGDVFMPMRRSAAALVLVLLGSTALSAAELPLVSRIDAVTVFADGASVTRKGIFRRRRANTRFFSRVCLKTSTQIRCASAAAGLKH